MEHSAVKLCNTPTPIVNDQTNMWTVANKINIAVYNPVSANIENNFFHKRKRSYEYCMHVQCVLISLTATLWPNGQQQTKAYCVQSGPN